jgi:hypothetical protein
MAHDITRATGLHIRGPHGDDHLWLARGSPYVRWRPDKPPDTPGRHSEHSQTKRAITGNCNLGEEHAY